MDYQLTWIYAGLLSLIYTVAGQPGEQYRCPNNDRRRTQSILPYHGRCYQFVHEERYWSSARDYCRDHGGRLVTVNDARTNRFLISALNRLPWSNSGVWIGLHDRDKELRWQWSTESGYVDEPVRFTYWARGHPKAFLHSIRDCVRMVRKSSWKWHETPCSALKWKYRFICEYGMLPPSTSAPPPTYPPGFHEPLQGLDWGQSYARPPPNTGNGDVRITADDVMMASTTKSPHKPRTTTKPEFYEEDSIDVIVPMQLRQDQGKDDGRGNMIFGIVGCVVGLICMLAFLIVIIFMRRRRRKEEEHSGDNPMYGATDEDEVKVKGLKVRPGVTGRIMNIYTNPSEHMDQMTALQRLQLAGSSEEDVMMLMPSGGESNGCVLDDENIQNHRLEDASQYLEPQSCMAHRPLPEVNLKPSQGQEVKPQGHQNKVKRKPQRFVRPKSPVPVSSNKESHHGKVSPDSCAQDDPQDDHQVENVYEDAEDVDENVYAEIPGDNIYESLDEMKKSLATMGEAEA